jgi:hypothetical protein
LKSLYNGYTLGEVARSAGFDWNEANILHIARHDVTSDEAEEVFWNRPVLMRMGKRRGELRFVLLGETDGGRCLLVVWAARNNRVRVVTSYPANAEWVAFYRSQRGV